MTGACERVLVLSNLSVLDSACACVLLLPSPSSARQATTTAEMFAGTSLPSQSSRSKSRDAAFRKAARCAISGLGSEIRHSLRYCGDSINCGNGSKVLQIWFRDLGVSVDIELLQDVLLPPFGSQISELYPANDLAQRRPPSRPRETAFGYTWRDNK